MSTRPTLLSSCARATTAAETRFRLNAPIADHRVTLVVALDEGATAVVRQVADQPWDGARFYTVDGPPPRVESNGALADIALRTIDGPEVRLSDELDGADAMVMVATADDGAEVASAIANACTLRGIMTAGLILGEGRDAGAAGAALRPHARVLVRSRDEHAVSDVLTALRA
jgi:hypothetical protein